MLEQEFNAGTLHLLRKAVLACATDAGMPESRALDVMLVVHELAANAVRYGGGRGRLRICTAAGVLHCQVNDPGLPGSDGDVPAGMSRQWPTGNAGPPSWPYQAGHGLWLVRQAADHFTAVTGRDGSQVTASFALRSGP